MLEIQTDARKLEALRRLLGLVELFGEDDTEGFVSDVETFGIAEVRRWLGNLLAIREGALRKAQEQQFYSEPVLWVCTTDKYSEKSSLQMRCPICWRLMSLAR